MNATSGSVHTQSSATLVDDTLSRANPIQPQRRSLGEPTLANEACRPDPVSQDTLRETDCVAINVRKKRFLVTPPPKELTNDPEQSLSISVRQVVTCANNVKPGKGAL